MNKSLIKLLAKKSIKNNRFDAVMIKKIASLLKRSDLKTYLKELKDLREKNTVYLSIPSNGILEEEAKKFFAKNFSGKQIEVTLDPSLIGGIRVRNYDMIYEISLKDELEKSLDYITEYDK